MESIFLSCVEYKSLFLSLLEIPESFDICAELVHKLAGDVSILEHVVSPASKSE